MGRRTDQIITRGAGVTCGFCVYSRYFTLISRLCIETNGFYDGSKAIVSVGAMGGPQEDGQTVGLLGFGSLCGKKLLFVETDQGLLIV